MWEYVRRKRPQFWLGNWILHHDNDAAHDELRISKFLVKNIHYKIGPYILSVRLSSLRFWDLPEVKKHHNARRFSNITAIQSNMALLRGIPENGFEDCFRPWHHLLTKCRVSQGKYLEDNSSNFAFTGQFRKLNYHSEFNCQVRMCWN
jgi:hypothetical protein